MHRWMFAGIALVTAINGAAAEEKRSLGAHEHGHGTFNFAVEGKEVLMELEVPGADIVGFEHAAESAADKAAVASAFAILEKPLELFILPTAAGCTVSDTEVTLAGEDDHDTHAHEKDEAHDDHKEEASHAHDDHKEEASEAHDDHKEEASHAHADHEDEASETHAEFHAVYALTCTAPAAITEVRFGYFATFPRAEELDVNVVTARGQRRFEATPEDAVVNLEGML